MRAFCLVLLLAAVSAQAAVEFRYVRLPSRLLTRDFMARTGFIRDHKWDDTYAFGYLPKGPIPWRLGDDLVTLDAREWAHFDHDAKTLEKLPPHNGYGPYEDFHTYETLTTEMKSLAAKYPSLATLYSAGKSVEGRELWYLRIANPDGDANKPKLLYVSSMHGDEVTGKEMMVYLIRELLEKHGTDPRLSALVDHAELFIMPSMNPDGTKAEQRFNANGVDLNRDFPGLDEQPFSTDGRAPETVALMNLHRTNRFTLAMNFHGGSLVVNIPWDSRANTTDKFGDDRLMVQLARQYADHNGPMSQNTDGSFDRGVTYGYEWYQVLGGMQDWADFFQSSLHATLEISNTKWPEASELPRYWQENRESILGYLEGGITGIHLTVTDPDGNFVPVDVDVDTASRTLHYEGGFVHRPTVGGAQKVTLRATGYAPQTLSLEAAKFDGSYTRIVMKKP